MKKQRFFLIALLLTSGALSFGCGQGFFAPYSAEECKRPADNLKPIYDPFAFAPSGDVLISNSPPKVAGKDTKKSNEVKNAIAALQTCKINNTVPGNIEKALAMLELEQKELEKNENNCK